MCGIAGFYNTTVTSDQINRLTGRLLHRGPDDQRTFLKGNMGFVHARLSVIELSELGAQPYHFENLSLIFNGELYNYQEVRAELQVKGYTFQSDSDTEVLIKAFHCWREKSVNKFIGMFAFSVYDHAAHAIWLFRDRLGVKPLYYSLKNGVLLFASEMKALSVLEQDRTIDRDSLFYYFRFGFVPRDRSIFKAIKKLKAGCYLKVAASSAEEIEYWNPAREVNYSKTDNQWLEELEELMISSFRYRMVSDVPVGVFLSGGIDSSLLAAILKRHYGPIHSFTIGFEEPEFDESTHARLVAHHLGIDHSEKKLHLSEAKIILDNFYQIYDEPFADTSGIPTSFVTQLAKQAGMKVVLSADGGDELFGGYSHYRQAAGLYNRLQKLPQSVRKIIAGLSDAVIRKDFRAGIKAYNAEHKLYALEELLRASGPVQFFEAYVANQSIQEVANLIGSDAGYLSTSTADDVLAQMMLWDMKYYLTDDLLVKVDRATMHHSIESREPFLDHRLVEFSQTMPVSLKIRDGQGKYIVKKLLNKYLPLALFERKKQGFSIPIYDWFSRELDELFKHYLSAENLQQIDCLNPDEVAREYSKYKQYKSAGKTYNIEKMWRILSYVRWWHIYAGHDA